MTLSALKTMAIIFAMGSPFAAFAQSDTDTRELGIIGNVPLLCAGGTLTGGGNFDLGVLIDTTTGRLRTDLSVPDRTLIGSFCSTRSTINIEATPLVAQNFTVEPPAGFSRRVDYTASADGWTENTAWFNTATTANVQASQTRTTPYSGAITVSLSNYTTNGGIDRRLVSDASYLGLVTVTITAAD